MNTFSEESLLLARHWDTVEDIFRAHMRLRKELASLLLSIKADLVKYDWWQDGWVFVQVEDEQVYISNKKWKDEGAYAIWIGVEGFTPEGVFGSELPPTLYVWVNYGRRDLAQILAEHIEDSDHEVMGEIDRGANCYVVWSPMRPCPSEELDTFDEVARKQILDFMAHYAQIVWSFDSAIRDYLANLEAG